MSEENKVNENEQNSLNAEEKIAPEVQTENFGFQEPAFDSKKMKLCTSCKTPISKVAKACPKCGAKNKKPIYKRFWFILAVVIAVVVLINIFSGLKKPESVVKVEDLIDAIGTVSIESESAIVEAENAVDALTAEERERVSKLEKLEKAREEYDEIVITEKVNEVQDLIKAIGKVSLKSKDKIAEARKAYDNCADEVKERIGNYDVLEAAEKQYSKLNVSNVISLIDSIGNVTLKSEKKINAAKEAYNTLTKEDKAKITNYKTLTKAEDKLSSLKKAEKEAKDKQVLAKLRSSYDRVEGITWYKPTNFPKYTDIRCFVLPYIGRNDSGYSWLRLRMNYTDDDDWIFWTKITFVVDGEKYYKSFSYYDVERDNDTEVWEYADIPAYDSEIALLNSIANSKETIVRFEGSNYRKDITISASDKTAIKQVLNAYKVVSDD